MNDLLIKVGITLGIMFAFLAAIALFIMGVGYLNNQLKTKYNFNLEYIVYRAGLIALFGSVFYFIFTNL